MSPSTTAPTMERVLAAATRAGVPALIWGAPGVGKTARIDWLAPRWGFDETVTISASSREPVDFMGLPHETPDGVAYAPLAWARRLNAARRGLLVVDEITTAASTFKAFLRIVQERYVGEYRLNDSVSIVALANPPQIAVDGVDLPAPVANRFLHLDWHFDVEGWLDGVGSLWRDQPTPDPSRYLAEGSAEDRARATQMVTGFLRSRPSLINAVPDDVEAMSRAWPSARSWTNLIAVLSHLRAHDEDARQMAVCGLVGTGAYLEFEAWLRERDLVDPAAALGDPSLIPFSDARPDRIFATLGSVTDLALSRSDLESWREALAVMVAAADAGVADIALPSLRRLLNDPHVEAGLPREVRRAFCDLFARSGAIREEASLASA